MSKRKILTAVSIIHLQPILKEKKVEEERKEKHRESEREKESEEEKEESGGGTQRGKWCSKKPASTLDWNLKVPGSIPGSTLREIIYPKTTKG